MNTSKCSKVQKILLLKTAAATNEVNWRTREHKRTDTTHRISNYCVCLQRTKWPMLRRGRVGGGGGRTRCVRKSRRMKKNGRQKCSEKSN